MDKTFEPDFLSEPEIYSIPSQRWTIYSIVGELVNSHRAAGYLYGKTHFEWCIGVWKWQHLWPPEIPRIETFQQIFDVAAFPHKGMGLSMCNHLLCSQQEIDKVGINA